MYLGISSGCIALVIGAGAGAGTFAYVNGNLSRTYQASYETAYAVIKSILEDMKQPILEEKTDGTQTTIRSQRVDETPMTINVRITYRGLEKGNLRAVSRVCSRANQVIEHLWSIRLAGKRKRCIQFINMFLL
jgi:hypothetical protein